MSFSNLTNLQEETRRCRCCLEKGFPITPGAIFSGPAGRRLFQWFAAVGWEEDEFRATHYITAMTKCYPGKPLTPATSLKPQSHGDRVPSAAERNLCAPFLEHELEIVQPELILPIGRVAINRFLGEGKPVNLIGNVFERDGRLVLPFPHPSGANVWLNRPESKRLIEAALGHLRQLKQDTQLWTNDVSRSAPAPSWPLLTSAYRASDTRFFLLDQGSTLCTPQQFVVSIGDAAECWPGAGGLRWSLR